MSKIVLWSGGMDSTLIIDQMITDNPNETVTAVSIVSDTVGKVRLDMEKQVKKEYLKKFGKRIDYREIKVDSQMGARTWQMPIWLCHVAPYINDNDEINLGYLSSDGYDFWNSKEKLVKAFNSLMDLQMKKAQINFPLQYWTKGDVIKDLKKRKIYGLTWYCGMPKKGKPCGKCMKCISVKRWSKYPDSGVYV